MSIFKEKDLIIKKRIFYKIEQNDIRPIRGIVTSKQIGDPAVVNPFFYSTDFLGFISHDYQNGHFEIVPFNKNNYNGL